MFLYKTNTFFAVFAHIFGSPKKLSVNSSIDVTGFFLGENDFLDFFIIFNLFTIILKHVFLLHYIHGYISYILSICDFSCSFYQH